MSEIEGKENHGSPMDAPQGELKRPRALGLRSPEILTRVQDGDAREPWVVGSEHV